MPKKTKANMKAVKTVTIVMYILSVSVALFIAVLNKCGVPVFEWESSLSFQNNNEEEREIIMSPAVTAEYGECEDMPTVKEFLLGAMTPVGKCLYIYGGGWNEEDTGAGVETMSYGVAPRWAEFFDEQDNTYEQEEHEYEIHNGLDCTGYLGYAAYQVFGDKYADDGYVFSSGSVGDNFLSLFGGTLVPNTKVTEHKAGDVMVKRGHVWIVVGECDDGSVLLLHSSPPNVTFSGTPSADGNGTEWCLARDAFPRPAMIHRRDSPDCDASGQ